MTAHRVAWERSKGPLRPEDKVFACPDEPACVRVEHLRLVGDDSSTAQPSRSGAPRAAGGRQRSARVSGESE